MAEIHATPEGVRAQALAKIEAREKAIHANAVKQGRVAERSEIMTKLGAQTLEEASQLNALRRERDSRPTKDQLKEHGRHRFHQGIGAGVIAGAVLTIAVGAALVPMLTQSTVSGVAVGSQVARQADNVRQLERMDRAP